MNVVSDEMKKLSSDLFNQSVNPLLEAKATERKEVMPEQEGTQKVSEETTPTDPSTVETAPAVETTVETVAKETPAEEMVPKANVEGEVKRRLAEELPNLVQQAVQQAMAGYQARPVQMQPQVVEENKYQGYSKAQLENVIGHPDATDQDRAFANRGLGVLEAEERAVTRFKSEQGQSEAQRKQSQSFSEIQADYPSAFNPQTGQWNLADPVVNMATQIFNSEPRLKAAGYEGLQVAMDRAFAKLTRQGSLETKKKEVKLNAQERQTQKIQSQALSGGTQAAPTKDVSTDAKLKKLLADYAKSQDPALFTQIAKLKGLIPSNLQ